jgi:hypothetical protein
MIYRTTIRIGLLFFVTGCATYVTPGRGAPMAKLGAAAVDQKKATDGGIAEAMAKRPLASFPAAVAIVRVQSPGYRSYTAQGWGTGQYSIITTRDVEAQADVDKLGQLPMLRGLAPLNRLVLSDQLQSDHELRVGAAKLHADMLLIYTLDTTFSDVSHASPLTIVTLGIGPTKRMRVMCTASAALMDTRSGYVYGLAEATKDHEELQNAWKTDDEIDQARRDVEGRAFAALVGDLQKTWDSVVREYAVPARASTGNAADSYPTVPPR